MHELSLLTSIPSTRHTQLLHILTGIAAMQPQPFNEKHTVFKPTRPAASSRVPLQVGGSQAVRGGRDMKVLGGVQGQGELFYLHLVGDLTSAESQEKPSEVAMNGDIVMSEVEDGLGDREMRNSTSMDPISSNEHVDHSTAATWILQFRDIPEAGNRRPVTSRLMADIPITSGDPFALMKAMEYTPVSTHTLRGHRWTHGFISLLLFQPLVQPSGSKDQDLAPLDPSGAYLLTASVKVQDGNKPEQMSRGVAELMNLKKML
ncbi:MAG: hypothetical protein Q9190_008102, partial [Brigantiaea leucoxantha]